jgi:hypothetical protein
MRKIFTLSFYSIWICQSILAQTIDRALYEEAAIGDAFAWALQSKEGTTKKFKTTAIFYNNTGSFLIFTDLDEERLFQFNKTYKTLDSAKKGQTVILYFSIEGFRGESYGHNTITWYRGKIDDFVFAQTEVDYAKFQGIWYAEIDSKQFPCLIFVDSTYMMISDWFVFGEFTIDHDKIILKPKNEYRDELGLRSAIFSDEAVFSYIFSDDKLLLSTDGESVSLSRLYVTP